jgi:type I restriction enzyme S subunit
MRPADDRVDPDFISYMLESKHFQAQAEAMGAGSVMRHFGPSHLRSMTVPLPPRNEQRAIASVLGALEDKIQLNRRINETLEAIAQLRFAAAPGSTAVPLGDLLTLSRDGVEPAGEPRQRFEHFSIPAFDDGQTPMIELGSAIKSSKLMVPPGSILLSKLNPHISRVWLPNLRGLRRPICSTEFLVAVPLEPASRELLYCLFRSTAFADEFASRVAGTSGSHQRVKAADALTIRVTVPDRADLRELTATLRPLFDRIAANRCESRTLAELRNALLPKLISGELRVRDAEAAVEASGA